MWLRRLRAFNALPWEGGFLDQPYVFMRELEAARDAETEYRLVQQRNLELKAQQLAEKGDTSANLSL